MKSQLHFVVLLVLRCATMQAEDVLMEENVDAIYSNGTFQPVHKADIALPDGARVRLTVEPVSQDEGTNVLDLAAKVYTGLSDEDVADVERTATDRTNFFSQ